MHAHAGVLPEDVQAVLPAVVGHRLRRATRVASAARARSVSTCSTPCRCPDRRPACHRGRDAILSSPHDLQPPRGCAPGSCGARAATPSRSCCGAAASTSCRRSSASPTRPWCSRCCSADSTTATTSGSRFAFLLAGVGLVGDAPLSRHARGAGTAAAYDRVRLCRTARGVSHPARECVGRAAGAHRNLLGRCARGTRRSRCRRHG